MAILLLILLAVIGAVILARMGVTVLAGAVAGLILLAWLILRKRRN